METALTQKDNHIRNLEQKIDTLRKQIDEEVSKQSKLREEHLSLKLNQNNATTELTHELRKKDHELDELKHQH